MLRSWLSEVTSQTLLSILTFSNSFYHSWCYVLTFSSNTSKTLLMLLSCNSKTLSMLCSWLSQATSKTVSKGNRLEKLYLSHNIDNCWMANFNTYWDSRMEKTTKDINMYQKNARLSDRVDRVATQRQLLVTVSLGWSFPFIQSSRNLIPMKSH